MSENWFEEAKRRTMQRNEPNHGGISFGPVILHHLGKSCELNWVKPYDSDHNWKPRKLTEEEQKELAEKLKEVQDKIKKDEIHFPEIVAPRKPAMDGVKVFEERSFSVPPGMKPVVEYVDVHLIDFDNSTPLCQTALWTKWQKHLQQPAGHQCWPCPTGEWRDGRFWILDGRHDFWVMKAQGFASVMVVSNKPE